MDGFGEGGLEDGLDTQFQNNLLFSASFLAMVSAVHLLLMYFGARFQKWMAAELHSQIERRLHGYTTGTLVSFLHLLSPHFLL
jgi:hypothetical protein